MIEDCEHLTRWEAAGAKIRLIRQLAQGLVTLVCNLSITVVLFPRFV